MNTLINIVLAVVLNLFSLGTKHHNDTIASSQTFTRVIKKQIYNLEDLRSQYLITKEELTQNPWETN